MAEELRFEKALRKGGAVDGDEGLVAPRARCVQRMREQFLAGTALASDEDRRIRRRQRIDHLQHPQDGGRMADDQIRPCITAGQRGVRLQKTEFQGSLSRDAREVAPQFLVVDWLSGVFVNAEFQCRDGVRNRGVRGHQNHLVSGETWWMCWNSERPSSFGIRMSLITTS